jgi:hypothetical protein
VNAWRVHRSGDTVRCPHCGSVIGEVPAGTIVRIRLRGATPAAPSFQQRCRVKECRRDYELQALDETANAA